MSQFGLLVAQALTAAFFAVLFLQSGLDKVFDWSGNKAYIASVFAKTPLKAFSTPMLGVVTLLEVAAGIFSAAGAIAIAVSQSTAIALVGAILSAVSLLSLFFGQRIAKDYAGAGGLVGYFIAAVGALLLHSQST
jgi:uncharacterized membrane protein YphA (DoxX/SURF4 family)